MIVRTWRGMASADRPDDYPAHFDRAVMPELQAVPGFVGAMLLRRQMADGWEFVVITTWASLEAIKAFAGERYERAVVEPGAVAALARFDAGVVHFEMVSGTAAELPAAAAS